MKKLVALLTSICLVVIPITVFAEDTSRTSTEEMKLMIESLQKQVEDLKKENEELKTQLGINTTSQQTLDTINNDLSEEVLNADTTIQYTDAITIQMVQNALNEAGYNCGVADGQAGTKTTEQITAYQINKGLVVNGVITNQLLAALNLLDRVAENVSKEPNKAIYHADYTYDMLSRNPDTYKGEKISFVGKVVQVSYEGSDYKTLLLAANSEYSTIIYVSYPANLISFRLLEDDTIVVYGTSMGVYTYETVRGDANTIPWINAEIIDLL